MPAVQMPDGSTVDLPDNPSPELKAAVQAKVELFHLGKMREQAFSEAQSARDQARPGQKWLFDANSPQLEQIDAEIAKRKDAVARANAMQGDWWDKTKYYAGQGGSAILRGLMGLPAMAASAGIATDPGRYPKDMTPATPLVDLSRLGMQPQTTGEKYAARAIEGATGAVAGPGGLAAPVRSAVVGGSAGLGSEGAAETLGDNPVTRILGALVGGGTAGIATAAKTTRGDLAREATRDATEADMRVAQELMRRSQEQGVTLNLSQAMPKASNIDEMVNVLAQSKNGPEVARTLRTQPTDVAMGMERELAALPGTARQPQLAANNVQEAADSAIREALGKAGQAWQKAAPQGSTVPPEAVMALDKQLAAIAAKYPNTTGAELIADARRALVNPNRVQGQPAAAILGPDGRPLAQSVPQSKYLTDAMQLRSALEDSLSTFGSRKLNTPGLDATNLRRAQEVREAFRNVIDQYAPKLSQANAAYSQVMSDVVAPMKQSVVGRVAGRLGYDTEREAVRSRVFGVLDKGTTPGASTSEILALEKALRSQPNGAPAFQDAVKTWMSNKISEATAQQGGRPAEATAANLEKIFMGNDVKAQGFKDMLVALARSQGLKDDALLNGMQNMMRITSAAARRPGTVSGVTPQGLEQASRSRIFGGVGNFSAVQPIRQPFKAIDDALNADAYGFMDKLLTSPEGVDTLIKLGRQPVMSKAAADTLATFSATVPTVQNPNQRKAGQQ